MYLVREIETLGRRDNVQERKKSDNLFNYLVREMEN